MQRGKRYVLRFLGIAFLLALLLAGVGHGTSDAQAFGAPIRLAVATFNPTRGESPDIPTSLMLDERELAGLAYYIVQFKGPIQEAWKEQLAAGGVELLEYIPDYAFKVRMTPERARYVSRLPQVVWIGLFHPAYKLDPNLKRGDPGWYRLVLEASADLEAVRAGIESFGGQVLHIESGLALIALDYDLLPQIARIADVAWIANWHERKLHNDKAAIEMNAPPAWSSGWTGAGQMLCIADSGIDTGRDSPTIADDIHRDFDNRFADRITSYPIQPWLDPYVNNPRADDGPADLDSGHGTHVSGSAAGNGARSNGLYRGIAYQADLCFQALEQYVDYKEGLGISDGYYLRGIPENLNVLFDEAYRWGARVHTNSWGGGDPGAYESTARQADEFTWNHKDMTILFSMGNGGKDADRNGIVDEGAITDPGTAKNVISVGACENEKPVPSPNPNSSSYGAWWPLDFPVNPLRDDPMADAGADGMVAFSSRGPTRDGRIKPDVVAPGTWILSTRSSQAAKTGWGYPLDAYYMYMGGTSMATPLVAGSAVVVRQFYVQEKGHANPSGALIKATLINTATDMRGQYPAPYNDAGSIPNHHQGWGVVNLAAATDGAFIRFQDENYPLSTGQVQTFRPIISSSAKPLKITIVWTDYPGTVGAAVELVNDLDLIVVAPDGTTYLGNVFQHGWSATGGTADRRNNVECVYIQTPLPGTYQIHVQGTNVPQGPQPFALVVTADFTPAATPTPTNTFTITPTPSPSPTLTPEIRTQRIPLHVGWNWFSFNLLPANPADIPAVLASIAGKYDLLLSEDKAYAPPPADPRFNTLASLEPGETYLIRMTQAAQEPNPLVIQGTRVSPDTPLECKPGWRWPGYLPDRPLPVATALSSLAGKYDLLLSEDKVYAPPPADPRFNTLAEMEPGEGYMIRMTASGTLIYPAATNTPTPTHAPSSTPTVSPTATPTPSPTQGGWVTILHETFEGSFPGSWNVFDNNGPEGGEYFWARRDCRAAEGSYSGWAVGGGANGAALSCGTQYPHLAESWMIYGPFSLADATAAVLTHKFWANTEENFDFIYTAASRNREDFYGYRATGHSESWQTQTLDLSNIPNLGNLLGQPNVWIAIVFSSDYSIALAEGAYVDDILLRKCTSAACTGGSSREFPSPLGVPDSLHLANGAAEKRLALPSR